MSYQHSFQSGKRVSSLDTAHGTLHFPTFMPVTTFGEKYPLDKMVQPYLKRLSQCLMVSHYYAQEMKKRPNMPIFVDSGGFAGLFEGAEIVEYEEYAAIKTREGDELNPLDVLHFQIMNADIGATLDFIIPPGLDEKECLRRQNLTIKNAIFAQKHNIVGHLVLYASLQCWDEASARRCAKIYADSGFEGIAVGGMVPRAKDLGYMKTIVRAVREEAPACAIHVFGIGNPAVLPDLIAAGADSFDSSSYVRNAVESRHDALKTSKGIHAGLYAAIENITNVNSIVNSTERSINELIPNAKLCLT